MLLPTLRRQKKVDILSEFSHKLKGSGWDTEHYHDFILVYRKQLEKADSGIMPLYRPL